jgi:hypothetical protein
MAHCAPTLYGLPSRDEVIVPVAIEWLTAVLVEDQESGSAVELVLSGSRQDAQVTAELVWNGCRQDARVFLTGTSQDWVRMGGPGKYEGRFKSYLCAKLLSGLNNRRTIYSTACGIQNGNKNNWAIPALYTDADENSLCVMISICVMRAWIRIHGDIPITGAEGKAMPNGAWSRVDPELGAWSRLDPELGHHCTSYAFAWLTACLYEGMAFQHWKYDLTWVQTRAADEGGVVVTTCTTLVKAFVRNLSVRHSSGFVLCRILRLTDSSIVNLKYTDPQEQRDGQLLPLLPRDATAFELVTCYSPIWWPTNPAHIRAAHAFIDCADIDGQFLHLTTANVARVQKMRRDTSTNHMRIVSTFEEAMLAKLGAIRTHRTLLPHRLLTIFHNTDVAKELLTLVTAYALPTLYDPAIFNNLHPNLDQAPTNPKTWPDLIHLVHPSQP